MNSCLPFRGSCLRGAWRAVVVVLALAAWSRARAQALATRGAEPLRVCIVAGLTDSAVARDALARTFDQMEGDAVAVSVADRKSDGTLALLALRDAHAAVFVDGPGRLGADATAVLRHFLQSGRGAVVLGATSEGWNAIPGFFTDHLGAEPAGLFAEGAPMSVINLFPHPIFAGVMRFETRLPMAGWQKLADNAQLILEGTVGEKTTPLAWVRRSAAGRICHVVPAGGALWSDAAYRRIVANAVRWTSARPIPDAQPIVQRTFMPESYPGSFAITFPAGPGVCFDPVRGGINFIWDGDFVDLRPRWLTKQGAPPRLFGEIFYREQGWRPLRIGAPDRETEYRFRGYTLTARGPEFHYEVNGRPVFETLIATGDGLELTREFRVGAGAGPLWITLEPQPGADVVVRGLERDGAYAAFAPTTAGEFAIVIRRKTGFAQP